MKLYIVYVYGTLVISLWEPGFIVGLHNFWYPAYSPDQVEAWTKLA